MKDQIALAGRAAKDHLYGIDTAGIVFADADDFLIIRANWDNKDLNIKKTAADINIGADSFVFVDVQPSASIAKTSAS